MVNFNDLKHFIRLILNARRDLEGHSVQFLLFKMKTLKLK